VTDDEISNVAKTGLTNREAFDVIVMKKIEVAEEISKMNRLNRSKRKPKPTGRNWFNTMLTGLIKVHPTWGHPRIAANLKKEECGDANNANSIYEVTDMHILWTDKNLKEHKVLLKTSFPAIVSKIKTSLK
jgi:hypothetical protein